MTTEEKIAAIEKKYEAARREQAREEARRDSAKAELKKLLKRAQEEYGVSSLADLEKVADRLKQESDEALADLEEKTKSL